VRWPALLARHGHSLEGVLQDTFSATPSSTRRDAAHSALGSSQTGISYPALSVSLNLFPLLPIASLPLHHILLVLAVLKSHSALCETTDGYPSRTNAAKLCCTPNRDRMAGARSHVRGPETYGAVFTVAMLTRSAA